jgi:hypothetical protein
LLGVEYNCASTRPSCRLRATEIVAASCAGPARFWYCTVAGLRACAPALRTPQLRRAWCLRLHFRRSFFLFGPSPRSRNMLFAHARAQARMGARTHIPRSTRTRMPGHGHENVLDLCASTAVHFAHQRPAPAHFRRTSCFFFVSYRAGPSPLSVHGRAHAHTCARSCTKEHTRVRARNDVLASCTRTRAGAGTGSAPGVETAELKTVELREQTQLLAPGTGARAAACGCARAGASDCARAVRAACSAFVPRPCIRPGKTFSQLIFIGTVPFVCSRRRGWKNLTIEYEPGIVQASLF